jgi:RimJ/RimL family protein N-acetyltransferase
VTNLPLGLTPEQSDAVADRIEAHFQRYGFGLCAAELRHTRGFIGFIGLAVPTFQSHFTPCVEIGWRLCADCWGQGLATEGAREMVRYGFEEIGLEALVSLTVPANIRSRRVMENLGMTRNPADDFDHPGLPEGHALRRHVLYRLALQQAGITRRAALVVHHSKGRRSDPKLTDPRDTRLIIVTS